MVGGVYTTLYASLGRVGRGVYHPICLPGYGRRVYTLVYMPPYYTLGTPTARLPAATVVYSAYGGSGRQPGL